MAKRTLLQTGTWKDAIYDPEDFSLRDGSTIINLVNFYAEYCQLPWLKRSNYLRTTLKAGLGAMGSGVKVPESFDQAKGNLLPRVTPRWGLEAARLQQLIYGNPAIPTQPRILGEHFMVDVVYDSPDSLSGVPTEAYESWGMSFDQVLAVAKDNMWPRCKKPFSQPKPGLYVSQWQDNYDASRLFMHDFIWQLEVVGQHVVAAPHRDMLIVSGSDDVEGIAAMIDLTQKVLTNPVRPLSGLLLRLQDETWIPYLPSEGHPAHKQARQLQVQTICDWYTDQKRLLDRLNEKRGIDVFVANYLAMESKETGVIQSLAAWTAGVDTLLPKADLIALTGHDKTFLGLAPWDSVAALSDQALEIQPEYYPARYRVNTFPTDQQIPGIIIR